MISTLKQKTLTINFKRVMSSLLHVVLTLLSISFEPQQCVEIIDGYWTDDFTYVNGTSADFESTTLYEDGWYGLFGLLILILCHQQLVDCRSDEWICCPLFEKDRVERE